MVRIFLEKYFKHAIHSIIKHIKLYLERLIYIVIRLKLSFVLFILIVNRYEELFGKTRFKLIGLKGIRLEDFNETPILILDFKEIVNVVNKVNRLVSEIKYLSNFSGLLN